MSVLRILAILAIIGLAVANDVEADFYGLSASVGPSHICVINQRNNNDEIGGQATCWHDGAPGREMMTNAPKDETFLQITTGKGFGCGLNVEQRVVCWGAHADTEIPGLFTQITGDDFYGCGIKTDNSIGCWGSLHEAPPTVGKYLQVDCHDQHCCALTSEGHPHCFGKSHVGCRLRHLAAPIDKSKSRKLSEEEEEDGYDDEDTDNAIEGEKIKFTQLSVGDRFSCGITLENRDIMCWGEGRMSLPGEVPALLKGPFKHIALDTTGLCGIYGEGSGQSHEEDKEGNGEEDKHEGGKLATKDDESDDPYEEVEAERDAVAIAAKAESKAQLQKKSMENRMKCWGSRLDILMPPRTYEEDEWDQVNIRRQTICAVTMDSELVCWGKGLEVGRQPRGLVVA